MISKMCPCIGPWLCRVLLAGAIILFAIVDGEAQIASFNFSSGSNVVSGWTNMPGDPAISVQTATAGGITISSVSTANWSPNSNGNSAYNGAGDYPGTYFPNLVMHDSWIQYNGSGNNLGLYNSLVPQLKLSGLNPDSTYTLRMTGSQIYFQNTTVYTVIGNSVAGSQVLTTFNNTSQGITFLKVAPTSGGTINIYVNCPSGLSGVCFSWICGLEVFSGSTNVGAPQVAISLPTSGTVIPEGGNVPINATATETAGSIVKVEFFEDTMKIGEVDTVPYNFTWVGPDPGSYTITVKATDNSGTINNASVSIGVKSLNYYWSTTGNVGNNADSTFVGNVDSVRLDFRTKNIQRMSITATGNVGIGTIAPTAQLHVAGSVRLASLTNDSTNADSRLIVSDTLGNLAYRNLTGNNGVITVGPGLGQTPSGAIALGDTVSGAGPHSFTASRYEYLNGYQYSIGGSVNDPVNAPNFRIYDNGDWTAGTTMTRSVNTLGQPGLRYYSKMGVLQIGASDWMDTTESKIFGGNLSGSGLLINSDTANLIKGRLLNSVFLGSNNAFDSTALIESSIVSTGGTTFSPGSTVQTSVVTGYGNKIDSLAGASLIAGTGNKVHHNMQFSVVTGGNNVENASTTYSFITGAGNQYGGGAQFMAGQNLINRVSYAATLGNGNVDFPTVPFASGISATNPLFAIGNSSSADSSIRSNAVTVLFNGRTQINTTGFSSSLTQSAVTPKAALEVVSTNTGVLLPKLTTVQRNAIATGDLVNGLLLYNTDSSVFQFYTGSSWSSMAAGTAAGGGWGSAGNTGTNPAVNFIGTTDTQRLAFRTDNIERMTILSNGAVAIGTSSLPASDAQLAVNGTIYAKKVKVTQTGWPDYVFDPGYTLPSLLSLEQFIRRNKHLPGIISAQEAEQKHVDLGDNQAALLKKIEELTLYLLAEHKKADDQQKEIERLKAENQQLADQQRQIDQLKEMVKKLTAKTN